MTRGEAIQWLEWCRDNYFLNAPIKWDVAQASRMAIEALSAEPCEDAISRQAAIDTVGFYSLHSGDKLLFADKPLRELPSVTPKQKMGHWVLTDDDFVYCSECEDSYYPRPIDASWYYCPSCGSRMVDPQESENKE